MSCTSIDWFLEWPKEALVRVASALLQDLALEPREVAAIAADPEGDKGDEEGNKGAVEKIELSENLAHHMATVHVAVGTLCER